MKVVEAVEVVGVDMEDEREATFDEAVNKACRILGNLDAFVHCYTYEGMFIVWSCDWYLLQIDFLVLKVFTLSGTTFPFWEL